MKPHVKAYLTYYGYTVADFIPCEVCNSRAVDIHHIDARGMGGSKEKDNADNLMALCRTCHEKYGDKTQHIAYLKAVHGYKTKQS